MDNAISAKPATRLGALKLSLIIAACALALACALPQQALADEPDEAAAWDQEAASALQAEAPAAEEPAVGEPAVGEPASLQGFADQDPVPDEAIAGEAAQAADVEIVAEEAEDAELSNVEPEGASAKAQADAAQVEEAQVDETQADAAQVEEAQVDETQADAAQAVEPASADSAAASQAASQASGKQPSNSQSSNQQDAAPNATASNADAASAPAGTAAVAGDVGAVDAMAVAGASLTVDSQKSTQAQKTVQGAWTRLWGENALGTMEEIVGTGFSRAVTVVIATNRSYHDALAASGLAGAYSAPILLTDGKALSDETVSEIQRLKPTQAFVCGGTDAISEAVFKGIEDLGLTAERLGGATALETAVALAERMGTSKSTTAILATSRSYHDALSIAPYAYAFKAPVFLTNPRGTSINNATYKALSEGGYRRIIITGGTAAISEAVQERVSGIEGISRVTRLGGMNAYGTSVEVANWELSNGMSVNNMGVATGGGYWDALTGAAFCGKNKAVLVLADDNNLSAVTSFINKHRSSIRKGYVFGGPDAVGAYAMATVVSGTVASVYDTLRDVDLAGHTQVGIDVSVWNGSINWSRVKASGVDYAILRAGYGSDYTSQDDSRFMEYVRGAQAAGIPLGVYLYSYGSNVSMAQSEANHTLRLLRAAGLSPADVPYGVWYDLEENSLARTSNRTLFANMATTYCNAIAAAGYTPGVYANLNWWNNYLTDPVFNNWKRWVAQYNTACWYDGPYIMWQCKSTGRVPGISGNVDMNIYYG